MSRRQPQLPIPSSNGFDYIYDAHYLKDVPDVLDDWNSRRVLLVVSKALDQNTTVVKDLEHKLGSRVIDKKQGVGSHSPYPDVIDIAHRVQDHAADAVVCLGSSSYSDACKTAVILAETLPHGFDEAAMESIVDQSKGVNDLDKAKPPKAKLICLPTSLSASEWNNKSSATNSRGKKQHFGHQDGAPRMIMLDAKVAKTAPPSLWLSSGVRSLDHCIEAICNPQCTPACEANSLQGLAELLKGLREYHEGRKRGHDQELEKGILECFAGSRLAIMGYVVFGNRFGPSHAIGHQLGSVAHVQHGVTSCICLGPVLRFTTDRNPEQQRKILDVFNQTLGWQEHSAADAFERFVKYLGLPTKLSEVGVTDKEQIDKIAELTLTDIIGKIPGSLNKEEILQVLEMAR